MNMPLKDAQQIANEEILDKEDITIINGHIIGDTKGLKFKPYVPGPHCKARPICSNCKFFEPNRGIWKRSGIQVRSYDRDKYIYKDLISGRIVFKTPLTHGYCIKKKKRISQESTCKLQTYNDWPIIRWNKKKGKLEHLWAPMGLDLLGVT